MNIRRSREVRLLPAPTGRNLLLTVTARSTAELANYVLSRLGTLDRVRAIRTHLVTWVIAEGASWRLTALTEAQQDRLRMTSRRGRSPA
jgi:hypothetical protein